MKRNLRKVHGVLGIRFLRRIRRQGGLPKGPRGPGRLWWPELEGKFWRWVQGAAVPV